jgi:hypothetical protein
VNNVYWSRYYSTTYPQGVDYVPEFARVVTGNAINLSTTSNGSNAYTLNTDYKVVASQDQYPTAGQMDAGRVGGFGYADLGCFFGVEWQAGASPPADGAAYYLVDCDLYAAFASIQWTNPNLFLQPWLSWDATAQLGSFNGVVGTSQSQTPDYNTTHGPNVAVFSGTPGGTTYVNFWVSCLSDKIVIVLRGDPGNGGYTTMLTLQKYAAVNSTLDKWNWCGVYANSTIQYAVASMIRARLTYDQQYWGDQSAISLSGLAASPWSLDANSSGRNDYVYPLTGGPTANPASYDGCWWLYNIYLYSNIGGKDQSGNYSAQNRPAGFKGTLRGVYSLANEGYANLDELVSGATTYLLLVLSSPLGASAGNSYIAVLEE